MKGCANVWLWAWHAFTLTMPIGVSSNGFAVAPVHEWTRQLGTTQRDEGTAVAVDRFGNVFLAGFTDGKFGPPDNMSSSTDMFISKFDTNGHGLWTNQIRESNANDFIHDLAFDNDGSLFVGGHSYVIDGGDGSSGEGDLFPPVSESTVRKLGHQGTPLWTATSYGSSIHALDVDGIGNVFATGFSGDGIADDAQRDVLLNKFSSSGALIWTASLASSEDEEALAVNVDDLGNVFIAGYTRGKLGPTRLGNLDAFIAKYDDRGNLAWKSQFGTTHHDMSQALAADGLGNVYVTGYLGAPVNPVGCLVKYDSLGGVLWTQEIESLWRETDKAIAVDAEGNVYLAGSKAASGNGANVQADVLLSKFDPDGKLLWNHSMGSAEDDLVSGLALDGLGNIYIAGKTLGNLGESHFGDYDAFLAKVHDPTAATHVIPEPRSLLIGGLVAAASLALYRSRAVKLHG